MKEQDPNKLTRRELITLFGGAFFVFTGAGLMQLSRDREASEHTPEGPPMPPTSSTKTETVASTGTVAPAETHAPTGVPEPSNP